MRPWIERLAKVSKDRGSFNRHQINIDNITWQAWKNIGPDIMFLNIISSNANVDIKIYEDEYDLLVETRNYVSRKTEDYCIQIINNL